MTELTEYTKVVGGSDKTLLEVLQQINDNLVLLHSRINKHIHSYVLKNSLSDLFGVSSIEGNNTLTTTYDLSNYSVSHGYYRVRDAAGWNQYASPDGHFNYDVSVLTYEYRPILRVGNIGTDNENCAANRITFSGDNGDSIFLDIYFTWDSDGYIKELKLELINASDKEVVFKSSSILEVELHG